MTTQLPLTKRFPTSFVTRCKVWFPPLETKTKRAGWMQSECVVPKEVGRFLIALWNCEELTPEELDQIDRIAKRLVCSADSEERKTTVWLSTEAVVNRDGGEK